MNNNQQPLWQGVTPPPVTPPPAMNPQQQVFQMIEKMVSDRTQALSATVSEFMGRLDNVEKYLAVVFQKMEEEESLRRKELFTRQESRLIALLQAGIATKEEARRVLSEFSPVEDSESKKKGRPKKEEATNEQG